MAGDSNGLEGCFIKLFSYGLIIAIIGGIIQWLVGKIVANIGPILVVVGIIAAIVVVCVIIGRRKAAKEAVAQWEQKELVPLLSKLGAMEKLNQAESLSQGLPREVEGAEKWTQALERRLSDAEFRGKSQASGIV